MKIIKEIRDEIKAGYRKPTKRDLNTLALIFLIFSALVGSYLLYWKESSNGYVWIGIGTALFVMRLVPPLFRFIYRAWITFAIILGYFVSRIILTLIFIFVMTPTGLLMRLFAKDPMERQMNTNQKTYWQKREQPTETSVERYERQF
ncbi:MAG: SxtJ family membrane protein [Pseudomonadota bacterium]